MASIWASASLAQETQEVLPTTLKSQPIPEGGQTTSKDGAGDQGQNKEPTSEKLSPSLDRIEAAIRDLVAQERAAQRQGPKNNEIRDLEAQEGMALWAKAMFWATIAAVLLTFAGIVLIWRTLIHTRHAAEAARNMVTEGAKTTIAAIEATNAAVNANFIARETSERQLRAYVTIEAIQTHPGDDPMSYRLEWKNTGQTPATDVLTYTNWESRIDALPDDFPYPKASINDAAALGPGQHVHAWPIFIPGETIERVRRGILRLYVWGAAEYNDTFKDTSRRRTEFCYEIVFDDAAAGDGQIAMGSRFCGPHNGIDDGCYHKPPA